MWVCVLPPPWKLVTPGKLSVAPPLTTMLELVMSVSRD